MRDSIKQLNKKVTEGREISSKFNRLKKLLSRITNTHKSLGGKRHTNQFFKWATDMNRGLMREDTYLVNECVNMVLLQLSLRKYITTVQYHNTITSVANINTGTCVSKDVGQLDHPPY